MLSGSRCERSRVLDEMDSELFSAKLMKGYGCCHPLPVNKSAGGEFAVSEEWLAAEEAVFRFLIEKRTEVGGRIGFGVNAHAMCVGWTGIWRVPRCG